jgi:periplasmic protein CpxP/Spy
MKATLVNRAAPLLITTMLVAVPAWAQSTSSPTASGDTTPTTGSSTAAAQTSSAPTGTTHKAMPRSSSHAASAPRQQGETMQSLVDRRITDLHGKLHITADQSQQWDQFTQVMRDNAKQMDDAYQQRAEKLGSMSAVDNMQSFAQIEQQRAQDTQKLVPAFQALYASLNDQQKKTADQLFRNYTASTQARHQAAAK